VPIAIQTSRQPWIRRPSGPVGVDWASPLARGLVGYVPTHRAASLVTGEKCAITGTAIDVSTHGLVRKFPGTAGDGTATDYLSGPTLSASSDLTGSAWVFITAYAGGNKTIGVATQDNNSVRGHYFGYYSPNGAGYVSLLNNGGSTPSTSGASDCVGSTTIPLSQWVHIAATRTSAGVAYVYLNGRNDTSGTASGWAAPNAQTTAWQIGRRNYPSFNDQFNGWIADVGVWSRALSPAEIWSLYDPRTRWSLYRRAVARTWFDLGATGGGDEAKSSSDTLALTLSESAALAAQIDATEALLVALTDAPSLAATVAASDAARVALTETPSLAAALAAADTLAVALTDAPALLAALVASDSLAVALSDAPALAAAVLGSDALSVSLTESPSLDGSESKTSSDTLAIAVTDTPALAAAIAGADTLSVSLADVPGLVAALGLTDTLSLALLDSPSLDSSEAKASSDTLSVALTEVAALTAQLGAVDTLAVILADVPALAAVLAASDTLALALTHGSAVIIDGLVVRVIRVGRARLGGPKAGRAVLGGPKAGRVTLE